MKNKRDYLNDASINEYHNYTEKGLKLRAKPFIESKIPNKKKNFLVVGLALGGYEEISALKHYYPDYNLYGIDIAKSVLKEKLGAKLIYSDVSDMKFDSNFFSGIMCSAVMHEVYSYSQNGKKKVEKAMSEISRCLVKNGVCAIREFNLPKSEGACLKCLTSEAKLFAKKFINDFRKSFEPNFSDNYEIKDDGIVSDTIHLYELLLHFRVYKSHFKSYLEFKNSKEIEEMYLPIKKKEYYQIFKENNLKLINEEYIDFSNYYGIIENNYELYNLKGKKIKNKFGFLDLVVSKK